MKGKIKGVTFLALIVLSSELILYSQLPKTSAQVQVNSANYEYNNVAGTDINASITANVGILTDGGISLWGIEPTITTNMSITTVIIRGQTNGSSYKRGLTFPSTAEFEEDTKLINISIFSMNIFSDPFKSIKENLLLLPDLYGIPNTFGFNVSVYVGNSTTNQTIYLSSDNNPLITIIFRNHS